MENNNNNNTFANFMTPKGAEKEKSGSSYVIGSNKTKESLKEARENEEEEKKKELIEAKKNSAALASRYGKSDMVKMQAKNIIMLIPFIIIGVAILILLLFKGGDWLSLGLNKLFKIMTNSK